MDDSVYSNLSKDTVNMSDVQHEEANKIEAIRVPMKNRMIVLMDHPCSLTLYSHVAVEVLSGSVSVFGYEIHPRSSALKVFSSEKTGLIEIKTETFDRIWKKKTRTMDLQYMLQEILGTERRTIEVLEKFGNSTVAILITALPFPIHLQFLELYYPNALKFNLYGKYPARKHFYVSEKFAGESLPVHFGLNEEKLSAEINSLIRSATLNDLLSPRIVVCGPKNSGKSTLIRFLMNKIISEHKDVCHLDTDPGQAEFGPPGVFSLTEVSKPVTGPPFYHKENPFAMVFIGDVSPTHPGLFAKGVEKLTQMYYEHFTNTPLLVNTMGWMEGFGLVCLKNVIKIVKPTVLIEIVTEDDCSMFDYREDLPEDSKYFQLCHSHNPKNSIFSPKELRELSLLSYFGKGQNYFSGPKPLNHIIPHTVSWDTLAFDSYNTKILPYRMIEAMSESIVALCAIPKYAILESNIPVFPKVFEDHTDNEFIGYGLVQAVDEERHLLYILSPISKKNWKRVNAIVKGNIQIPDCLVLTEEIYDFDLPFTDERNMDTHNDRDEEMVDQSMLSLKSFSGKESPTNAMAFASCYSKKIGGRYKRINK